MQFQDETQDVKTNKDKPPILAGPPIGKPYLIQ